MSLKIAHIKKPAVARQEVVDLWEKVLKPKFEDRDKKTAIKLFNLPGDYFDTPDSDRT